MPSLFLRQRRPGGGKAPARARTGLLAGPRSQLVLGLALSLLLHAALVLPWMLGGWSQAPAPRHRQLVVDLFGMVSHRQVEQQRAGAEPEPRPRPATPAPKAVARKSAPNKPVSQAVPSPVLVAESPERQRGVEAPQPVAPPEPTAAAGNAPQEQKQQTIQAPDTSAADAMRKYLGGLRKKIQANTVYPERARSLGYTGAPVIRFTLMPGGDIQPGSLAIVRGSGHAELDESALQAARASAPLPPPPHQMNVVIDLTFEREN